MSTYQLIGVTGTNGKSSVVTFTRQLLERVGIRAASVGQRIEVGEEVRPHSEVGRGKGALVRYFDQLAQAGTEVIITEVYSAALARGAHHGLSYDLGAFTNLTSDHLNVHGSFAAYCQAKLKFFDCLRPGATVVLPELDNLALVEQVATERGLPLVKPDEVDLCFTDDFMQENARMALTLAGQICPEVRTVDPTGLQLPPGRMTRYDYWGATLVIDFAHNEDGLRRALQSLRKKHQRVHLILSSKGGWGQRKREQLGKIALELADTVTVTDDDPRTEDPALIRAQLKVDASFREVPPRARAIASAAARLRSGDALLIAGRGADDGWVGAYGRRYYSDVDVVERLGATLR